VSPITIYGNDFNRQDVTGFFLIKDAGSIAIGPGTIVSNKFNVSRAFASIFALESTLTSFALSNQTFLTSDALKVRFEDLIFTNNEVMINNPEPSLSRDQALVSRIFGPYHVEMFNCEISVSNSCCNLLIFSFRPFHDLILFFFAKDSSMKADSAQINITLILSIISPIGT
jgi:hypothetical protein